MRIVVRTLLLLLEKKTVIACFVGIFLLEASLSFWTGLPYDMKVWFNTGSWMSQGINIYLPNDHIGYPPLWAFWCLIAFRFYSFFGNNTEIWRFIIKLPMILAQLALAFAIGKFAESRFDHKTARKIFLLTLTWSFFIYIGALWGQIDILSALLTFLAFYAVVNKRNRAGALLLGIAITLKIYPLITLPAFLAYISKKQDRTETGKFLVYACAVPVLFTVAVFAVFRWDILFFLKTIFYWSPVSNPVQIQGGCMNIWSFVSLFNIDISSVWFLRLVWIPVLGAGALYWFRKPSMDESELTISLISLYILFMITYGWVTEQTFLDPLPFIFLVILGYRFKRSQFYSLAAIQILVYAFSAVNYGEFIFQPLVERFFPPLLASLQYFNPVNPLIWSIRGTLGLIISLSLGGFLMVLLKTSVSNPNVRKPRIKRLDQ
jgi:hypothetical protein